MKRILTIRADCSPTMGTGHVMRMIALGQAWQQLGGRVRFLGQTTPLHDRLESEGFQLVPMTAVHPAPSDIDCLLCETKGNEWVAIDGYHFDKTYQTAIRAAGRRTLVLDDFFDRKAYDATILLNQNPDGTKYPYDLPKESTLLLGTRYALLRKDFQRSDTIRPVPEKAENILVTLGGADMDNMTSTVLSAIAECEDTGLHIKIVAGAANPHLDVLKAKIAGLACRCELLVAVDDMPTLMRWADLAVSAGGSTCWELCFFGLPAIAIRIADNQEGVIKELRNHGAAICLDSAPSVGDIASKLKRLIGTPHARQTMREAGMRLVDGKGAIRVAKTMFDAP